MKIYVKPEIEIVDFTAEEITNGDHMGGTTTSSDVNNPWGN